MHFLVAWADQCRIVLKLGLCSTQKQLDKIQEDRIQDGRIYNDIILED